jgi:hypothetical protein
VPQQPRLGACADVASDGLLCAHLYTEAVSVELPVRSLFLHFFLSWVMDCFVPIAHLYTEAVSVELSAVFSCSLLLNVAM